jgi:P27 family predicted phage terminase small subunit
MGRRGPPPKPTKLKLLHGESRPSRVGNPEPQPRERLPRVPDWLTAEAREVWDRTVAELDAMGLAYAADTDSLVIYVNAVVNYVRAQKILDLAGVMIKGVDGGIVRNPANAVVKQNAAIVGRFAREFGLTPSARVGLTIELRDPEDSRDLAARLLS